MNIEDYVDKNILDDIKSLRDIENKIKSNVAQYSGIFSNFSWLEGNDMAEIRLANRLSQLIFDISRMEGIVAQGKDIKKVDKLMSKAGISKNEILGQVFSYLTEIQEFLNERKENTRSYLNRYFSDEFRDENFWECKAETLSLYEYFLCIYEVRNKFVSLIKSESEKIIRLSRDFGLNPRNGRSSPEFILSAINDVMNTINRDSLRELLNEIQKFYDNIGQINTDCTSKVNIKEETAASEQWISRTPYLGREYRLIDEALTGIYLAHNIWITVTGQVKKIVELSACISSIDSDAAKSMEISRIVSQITQLKTETHNIIYLIPLIRDLNNSVHSVYDKSREHVDENTEGGDYKGGHVFNDETILDNRIANPK